MSVVVRQPRHHEAGKAGHLLPPKQHLPALCPGPPLAIAGAGEPGLYRTRTGVLTVRVFGVRGRREQDGHHAEQQERCEDARLRRSSTVGQAATSAVAAGGASGAGTGAGAEEGAWVSLAERILEMPASSIVTP